MLTIYGSDLSGPAIKVRLTASFLGLEYKWHAINLREGEQKREWFLKINPLGKIPAIDDEGFYLFESNAICKYLCDRYNAPRSFRLSPTFSFYPKNIKPRAVIDQWVDFVTLHIGANFMPIVYNRIFAPLRGMPVNEKAITDGLEFLKQYFPAIENQLEQQVYVASNEISLADIALLAILEPAEMAKIDLKNYPKLTAWRAELKKQPFYTNCYREYGEALKMTASP